MTFRKVESLLSVSADVKTKNGEKKGILTGIMYLAPNILSGYQVCPKATEGCKAACLYTAGRGIYDRTQQGRINKTKWFFEDRESFMETLVSNIERLIRKANRMNMIPAVRLNGTSDIAWEKIACVRNGKKYKNLMQAFDSVGFYDYSKVLNRKAALALPNYHLTFSLSESNDKDARKALDQGYNLAVVLNVKRKQAKPETFWGYPVVNGDDHDARFPDPKGGHIVGLTAKGKARYDQSGFVRSHIG